MNKKLKKLCFFTVFTLFASNGALHGRDSDFTFYTYGHGAGGFIHIAPVTTGGTLSFNQDGAMTMVSHWSVLDAIEHCCLDIPDETYATCTYTTFVDDDQLTHLTAECISDDGKVAYEINLQGKPKWSSWDVEYSSFSLLHGDEMIDYFTNLKGTIHWWAPDLPNNLQ